MKVVRSQEFRNFIGKQSFPILSKLLPVILRFTGNKNSLLFSERSEEIGGTKFQTTIIFLRKIVDAHAIPHFRQKLCQQFLERRGIYDSSELQIVNLQRLGIREKNTHGPYFTEKPKAFPLHLFAPNYYLTEFSGKIPKILRNSQSEFLKCQENRKTVFRNMLGKVQSYGICEANSEDARKNAKHFSVASTFPSHLLTTTHEVVI